MLSFAFVVYGVMCVLGVVALGHGVWDAPEGFEDDDGFHLGAQEPVLNDRREEELAEWDEYP